MLTRFHLLGKNINLTGDEVTISSSNFNVDKNGNVICNNATMNNATMNNADMQNASINGGNLKMWGNTSLDGVRVFADSSKNTSYMAYMVSDSIGVNRGNDMAAMTPTAINIGDSTMYNDHITTPTVIQTSLKSRKKNFKKLENALQEVLKTDIYEYHFKNQNDIEKKHIGFLIGEDCNYSNKITALDENGKEIGVDNYSMVSVLWKAVQELSKEVEMLKKKEV